MPRSAPLLWCPVCLADAGVEVGLRCVARRTVTTLFECDRCGRGLIILDEVLDPPVSDESRDGVSSLESRVSRDGGLGLETRNSKLED